MRTRYLLCYDVRDDERLRRMAKLAEAYGYRLQYSVFLCDLSAVERSRLERAVRRTLELDVDGAVLIDLGPAGRSSAGRFHWLSRPPDIADPDAATIL
jgi:CRISPR-associated protein Cas2